MQSFNSYADNLCDWCGKRTRRWVDDGSGGKAAICNTHILFFGVDDTNHLSTGVVADVLQKNIIKV